jgi:hypothetical protein
MGGFSQFFRTDYEGLKKDFLKHIRKKTGIALEQDPAAIQDIEGIINLPKEEGGARFNEMLSTLQKDKHFLNPQNKERETIKILLRLARKYGSKNLKEIFDVLFGDTGSTIKINAQAFAGLTKAMDSIETEKGCAYLYQIFKQLQGQKYTHKSKIFNGLIVLENAAEAKLKTLSEILSTEYSRELPTEYSYYESSIGSPYPQVNWKLFWEKLVEQDSECLDLILSLVTLLEKGKISNVNTRQTMLGLTWKSRAFYSKTGLWVRYQLLQALITDEERLSAHYFNRVFERIPDLWDQIFSRIGGCFVRGEDRQLVKNSIELKLAENPVLNYWIPAILISAKSKELDSSRLDSILKEVEAVLESEIKRSLRLLSLMPELGGVPAFHQAQTESLDPPPPYSVSQDLSSSSQKFSIGAAIEEIEAAFPNVNHMRWVDAFFKGIGEVEKLYLMDNLMNTYSSNTSSDLPIGGLNQLILKKQ